MFVKQLEKQEHEEMNTEGIAHLDNKLDPLKTYEAIRTTRKHGVHGLSCAAHVFAQKQHVRRTFVRTFTIPPPHGTPTPPHPTPPKI